MNRFSAFWNVFWSKIVGTFNKIFRREKDKTFAQKWDDLTGVNLLDIVCKKLTDLSMIEATFDVESDSTVTEPLKGLCKDLEDNRYRITSAMLATGDYAVFPATNRKGEIIHSFLPADRFVITDMDGIELTEVYGVIDEYVNNKGEAYRLIRHHKLDSDGSLLIEVFTVDDKWDKAVFSQWQDKEMTAVFQNANHIGVGHYKSPASARGHHSVYGVPINYGCGEIEQKILEDITNRDNEMNNGKSILFADQRILENVGNKSGYKINEFVFPKKVMAGAGGSEIDIYNPSLRITEYNEKLQADLALYESQIGLSKGILTDAEPTSNATATEINTANADTVSVLNSIQNAIDIGNEQTLKADGVFLNISPDLWSYKSDYYNPFENPDAQFERLSTAIDKGAAEPEDMTQWLFPSMTRDEIQEKIDRINAKTAADTDAAIERALSGA